MKGYHVPARSRQVLDEVETDKARTARDERGLVRHDLFFLISTPCMAIANDLGPEL